MRDRSERSSSARHRKSTASGHPAEVSLSNSLSTMSVRNSSPTWRSSLSAEGVTTLRPYTIMRFCPGDQRRTHLPVQADYADELDVDVMFRLDDAEWSEAVKASGPFGLRDFIASTANVRPERAVEGLAIMEID